MLRLYGADNEEITDQPTQFCGNPACLGEPWCSAWGICKDSAVYGDTAGVNTSESSLATSTHGRSELEIDDLFLQASQAFESSSSQHHQRPCAMALHKPSSIIYAFRSCSQCMATLLFKLHTVKSAMS